MSEWTKIPDKDRKWELKHNGVVLGTIFRKPNHPKMPSKYADQYSLYVSSPKVYDRFSEVARTHMFDTFEEAVEAFETLGRAQVLPWAETIVDYFIERDSSVDHAALLTACENPKIDTSDALEQDQS